jgi:hypothetical protein
LNQRVQNLSTRSRHDSVFAVHRNRGCFESAPKSTRVPIRGHDELSFFLEGEDFNHARVDSNEAPKYLDVLRILALLAA